MKMACIRHILFLSIFFILPTLSPQASARIKPDSVGLREIHQAEQLLQRAEKSGDADTLIAAQKAVLQIYRNLLAEKTPVASDAYSNYPLNMELTFVVFALFTLSFTLLVKSYLARHKSKVEVLRCQMDAMDELLMVRKSAFIAQAKQDESFKKENEERIKKLELRKQHLESSLSQEDLEEVRVLQFRANKIVQSLYRKCDEGKLLDDADCQSLLPVIESIAPRALSFLEQRKPRMIEEDYRMCLLILAGMAPKHIVRLLCCTSQKVSMQRKRYLKEFFSKEGKPSEFDILLRTL